MPPEDSQVQLLNENTDDVFDFNDFILGSLRIARAGAQRAPLRVILWVAATENALCGESVCLTPNG